MRINYYEESYIDDDGAVESENGFYFGISNHDFTEEGTEGFHGGGPIDTELGTDRFASYVHPCATQINGEGQRSGIEFIAILFSPVSNGGAFACPQPGLFDFVRYLIVRGR